MVGCLAQVHEESHARLVALGLGQAHGDPAGALLVVRDELKVEVLLRRRHRHLDHLLRLLRQVSQHLEKSE